MGSFSELIEAGYIKPLPPKKNKTKKDEKKKREKENLLFVP